MLSSKIRNIQWICYWQNNENTHSEFFQCEHFGQKFSFIRIDISVFILVEASHCGKEIHLLVHKDI